MKSQIPYYEVLQNFPNCFSRKQNLFKKRPFNDGTTQLQIIREQCLLLLLVPLRHPPN